MAAVIDHYGSHRRRPEHCAVVRHHAKPARYRSGRQFDAAELAADVGVPEYGGVCQGPGELGDECNASARNVHSGDGDWPGKPHGEPDACEELYAAARHEV